MEEILERCAGLDVHRDTVVASIMIGYGKQMTRETKTFGTTTDDLRDLLSWLNEHKIKDIGMESTGIYWLPVFNILEEGIDIRLTLANARNAKNVPGRKTDVKDSEWICKILKAGLLEKSFIPPETIRHLRSLCRYRTALVRERASAKNRIIKVLEASNVKISSVFSDIFCKAGWRIVELIVQGESDLDVLTAHIPKQVKASKAKIKKAIKNLLQEHHIDMLKIMMNHVSSLERLIADVENEIREKMLPFNKEVELLKTIPGISDTTAQVIISELGTDMRQFPTENHAASWSGLAPGNNESAGKKKTLE